uniref:Uncharacterized protein n=1 Tax=Acrobeloides nanus TaxID=290746 RepID=A0A914DNE1_9BILA
MTLNLMQLHLETIEWSGDAVVHVEFNGTIPYSVNDKVAEFMHIVDKNGSRIIGGFIGYIEYWDYLALPDIKVYYGFDYPIKNLPPTPAGPLPIFDWTLKFTYIPVQDTGLGIIDSNYVSGVQIRNAIICGIDAIALVFALHLIRKKSTTEMKVYCRFLLNISGFLDGYLGHLT